MSNYDPTIEDTYKKWLEVDGNRYLLNIWDSAGTEQFMGMRDRYFREGQGFVLVYSITSETSFIEALDIRKQIITSRVRDRDRDGVDDNDGTYDDNYYNDIPIVLVGNKCDLQDERQVGKFRAAHTANYELRCPFIESSAKDAVNVEEIFRQTVRQLNPTAYR